MPIPRRDPTYTLEHLYKDAQDFLAAGMKFWEGRAKAGMDGAVVWYKDSAIGTVIFTRGEYDWQLTKNIENSQPTVILGASKDE